MTVQYITIQTTKKTDLVWYLLYLASEWDFSAAHFEIFGPQDRKWSIKIIASTLLMNTNSCSTYFPWCSFALGDSGSYWLHLN